MQIRHFPVSLSLFGKGQAESENFFFFFNFLINSLVFQFSPHIKGISIFPTFQRFFLTRRVSTQNIQALYKNLA